MDAHVTHVLSRAFDDYGLGIGVAQGSCDGLLAAIHIWLHSHWLPNRQAPVGHVALHRSRRLVPGSLRAKWHPSGAISLGVPWPIALDIFASQRTRSVNSDRNDGPSAHRPRREPDHVVELCVYRRRSCGPSKNARPSDICAFSHERGART